MDKILVFPCGSEIGLEIARAFKGIKQVQLVGGSSVSDHGKFVFDYYIGNIPRVDSPEFLEVINQIVDDHEIDYIFPAHDDVVVALANAQSMLHCKVIGSPSHTAKLSRSKAMTYRFFKSIITVPTVYSVEDLDDDIIYPVFLKPDVGQGSKGTYKAFRKAEVLMYLEKDPTLLILEYLPGEEFTVDCYSDKDGVLQFSGARRRNRILNGISVNTTLVDDHEIDEIAFLINSNVYFKGAWFFQVKRNRNNKLSLLEIAPRIAGSMALYRMQGVNLPLLSYYCQKGIPCEILQNKMNVELDRALMNRYRVDVSFKHVYVDFDDCIYIDSGVNEMVIQFLFKCLNNGVKIYLITRHKGDIYKTLTRLRIRALFDEIIHIKNRKEKKSDYIRHRDAIFIDDSHLERRDVALRVGLPVFSVDSLECLLNGYMFETTAKLVKK